MPYYSSIIEEFEQYEFRPNADSKISLAIGSVLYDCLNQICIDSDLAPCQSSERGLLMNHLEHIKEGN